MDKRARGKGSRRRRVWVGVAVVVAVTGSIAGGLAAQGRLGNALWSQVARAQSFDESAAAPGGVFDLADLQRMRAVRPPRPVPAALRERVRELTEQHRQAVRALPQNRRPATIPEPAPEVGRPPRMDSGDTDPDRLLAPSRALTGR